MKAFIALLLFLFCVGNIAFEEAKPPDKTLPAISVCEYSFAIVWEVPLQKPKANTLHPKAALTHKYKTPHVATPHWLIANSKRLS